jgi:hypothetical protein
MDAASDEELSEDA